MVESQHVPSCFILASEDKRICNETAKSVYKELRNPHNEMNVIVGASHENLNFEEQYLI